MWSSEERMSGRRAVLAEGAYGTAAGKQSRGKEKLSRTMAMILGVFVTLEIMTAGAMIFDLDLHSADAIALLFGFMVLYSGVVALLTDN